jgi:tRNA modification GTPase
MSSRYALLTPPGLSAVATIAVEGAGSDRVLAAIFHSRRSPSDENRLLYGKIVDKSEIIDHVIVARCDVTERFLIHCHGGPRILQRIMQVLQNSGAKADAWKTLNTPQTIQEEVLQSLPHVKTRLGALAFSAQCPGGLTNWAKNTLQKLKMTRSLSESFLQSVRRLGETYDLAKRLLHPSQVVLAGPTNAGKSSLANALTGRQQSIVADLEGTTRDWTSLLTDVEGVPIELIDSPGRRESQNQIEQNAIGVAERKIQSADLILLIVEYGKDEVSQIDRFLSHLPSGRKVIVLINKADKMTGPGTNLKHLTISAKTGANLNALKTAIFDNFGFKNFDFRHPMVFTDRQHHLVQKLSTARERHSAIRLIQTLLNPREDIASS